MKIISNKVYKLGIVAIMFFIGGCVNFRVNYPEINYYNLNQPNVTEMSVRRTQSSIQIREFSISRKYSGNRIYISENNAVRPYYYHRWLTDFNELFTDFIRVYFAKTKYFGGGVLAPEGIANPDYIVQGRIIEYDVINDKENKKYIVKLSVSIVVIETGKNAEYKEIFSDDYSIEVNRSNDEAKNIPVAFEIASKEIASKIYKDITDTINSHLK